MSVKNYTLRLKPGDDVFNTIQAFVQEQQMEAGCIVSGVGSLTHAMIRLANRLNFDSYTGYFEIVSLTGLISVHGLHVHMSISDGDGMTIGGHLESGCLVYTTVELVILAFEDEIYKRELLENDSGYEELVVYKK
jgi:predicted DNA-binding protein with PD1-like motif